MRSTRMHLDVTAVRCAAGRSALHGGLERAHICGLATRSSTTTSTRASCAHVRDARPGRTVLRWPDQRHHRLRRGSGAGLIAGANAPASAGARAVGAGSRPGLPGVLVDDLVSKGITEPYACSRAAPSSDCSCAKTRRPALDGDRPWPGLVTMRAGLSSSASASVWRPNCSACEAPGCGRKPCRQPTRSAAGKALEHDTAWPSCCAGPASATIM